MKKTKIVFGISLAFLFFAIAFISCKKPAKQAADPPQGEPSLPANAYSYSTKHGVNDNVATLGRVLFYDKNLSYNSSVACGSCHKQQYAFADNVIFSKGANGLNLTRNSPSIQGVKGFTTISQFEAGPQQTGVGVPTADNQVPVLLFWDGRQRNMADMVLNPVLKHTEMGLPDFNTLVTRLGGLAYYPPLFQKAFGDQTITKERIALALEGFVSCLNTDQTQPTDGNVSTLDNSDPVVTNNNGFVGTTLFLDTTGLSPLERQGQLLFHSKYNCASCHDPSNTGSYGSVTIPDPNAPDTRMFNIGLDVQYPDQGLGAITGKPGDMGLFKVPTLKNISVTAPYMHDGRYATLDDVLEHYSHGVQPNVNLSFHFRNPDGTTKQLNIAPAEKVALIAFLSSLKDNDFLTSDMYSDPFKK